MNINYFKNFYPYFNESENWGDISKLEWYHVHHLFLLRKKLGDDYKIIINCSYKTSGHSNNSYHYHGIATDFHLNKKFDLYEQYLMIERALKELDLDNFVGLGCYLNWNTPGFHLDSRGSRMRWVNKFGKYFYFNNDIDDKWMDLHA